LHQAAGEHALARSLVERWPGAQLVRLDDMYPGWDGLAAASAAVPDIFRWAGWRSWDWEHDREGAWHVLDATRPIIVEGVGAISRASRPLVDWAIWVELDDETRKVRALERDGDRYAPHWDRWAAQEAEFIARENPFQLADAILKPGGSLELDRLT
ncbi:MAG: hypothetical protein EPN91_01225, partial [Salinibacterium sp.]